MPKFQKDLYVLKRVLSLAKPHKLLFVSAAILVVIIAPLATLKPKLIQVMTDDYVFKGDQEGMKKILYVLIAVLFLEAFLSYSFAFVTGLLGANVVRDLRVKVFSGIMRMRLKFFDTTPVGTSTTRTISDIETINAIFAEGIITIIADILTLVTVLGMMFYTSWKLTLVCMTTLPVLIVASIIFKEKVKVSFQRVRAEVTLMNGFLQERITGMKISQIFNAEEQDKALFKVINRRYTKANLDSILYYAVFFPVVEIISAASLGLMVWYGARGVIDGHISLGVMIAFPIYINMLFRPIRMLADKFNTLQMGIVAAERVFSLLDSEENAEVNGHFKADKISGDVIFKDVKFAYNDQDYVLKGVNFHAKQNETLAIVGSTGSGKTTIISLLNRFYDIQKGSITINGVDIKEWDIPTLRSKIAVVLQDVFLFSGTVIDNITMRDPNISRQQAIDAAILVGADAFIKKLPKTYDFEVMERGGTLSVGQRQLISFARALVFNPDILILDEATSSIDTDSETIIQNAIEKLIDNRTSIVIAHRLSTVRKANSILVMDQGIVSEFGDHNTLIANEHGIYRKLYDMQFNTVESV